MAYPHLASVRLIAEPRDTAGAYQLGRDFPGITWLHWNGRFRDDARRFVRGDPGLVGALMTRLYGTDDLFPDDRLSASHAYQSVNCVTWHDGFTLYDLVACNQKRNWATGHGNSNPYKQDDATSWLAWDRLGANRDVFRFFKRMIAFRKAHRSRGRSRFWRDDVCWYGVGPAVDVASHSRSLAFYLDGASQEDPEEMIEVARRAARERGWPDMRALFVSHDRLWTGRL